MEYLLQSDDPKTREAAKVLGAKIDALKSSAGKLIEYRRRNMLNFQLEKADTFINRLATDLAD